MKMYFSFIILFIEVGTTHAIIGWNFIEQNTQPHSVACPIENPDSYPVARRVEYIVNYPPVRAES